MNWPLINISHMIERIEALKPKKFAKFDMTKGYWQLGLGGGRGGGGAVFLFVGVVFFLFFILNC
jgi:hypothetical protein